jgi:hypothetical protein
VIAALALLVSATGSDLDRGIQLFADFEDAKAEAVLRAYLKTSPPAAEAAKTHLYLGLIAFNALDSDKARREFAEAIRTTPSIELPYGVSPKARLLFDQVQRETIEQEARTKVPAGRPRGEAEAEAPPPRSRAPAYIVGAIGLAGIAAGGILGALAASDLSAGQNKMGGIQIQTALADTSRAGTEGLTADILFGVGGAAVITGIILWIVEAPGDAPTVGVAPNGSGASVQVLGRF